MELAAYVAAHKVKQLTQHLFYSWRSEGFSDNTLKQIVNGIDKGTRLTNLAEFVIGVRMLMALVGHSNMVTSQRHIDLCPAMMKAAVELV